MIDTIDAALRDAMPILAVTFFPALTLLTVALTDEWHRLGQPDQHSVNDYYPVEIGRATVPAPRTAGDDTATTDLAAHAPLYARLRAERARTPIARDVARDIARVWLRDLGHAARQEVTR